MDSIEIVLLMLLAVVGSGYLVRALPFSLPLPVVQIVLGVLIAAGSNQGVTLEPEIFFLLFLPPLLFIDGWRIPKDGLFRDRNTILELALGLVVFTVIGAGFLIHWLIPEMPLPVAFALAAIVSPTDPVAVSSIAARVPIPKRLMHILEGESLLNDASGLVCFRFALATALTGHFSLTSAALTFVWVALASLAIGCAVTAAVSYAERWLSRHIGEESGSPILVNLLIPFGAYLIAEHVKASGILAAVAAGITMSYVELNGRALASTRVQRAAVWNTVQLALNGIMFLLLGEQLPAIWHGATASIAGSTHASRWWLAAEALTIGVGLTLLRFLWVWVSLRLTLFKARQRGEHVEQPHWRLIVATSLAGVRGAITLAGILTLPLAMPDGTPFPTRDLAIFLASAVILLSLLIASVGLPRILRGLTLPEEPTEHMEEDRAREAGALAALAALRRVRRTLPQQEGDSEAYVQAAAHVGSLYERRLEHAAVHDKDSDRGQRAREADEAERKFRLAALRAEREAVFELARRGEISDVTSRKLVREIDLIEARYR